MAIPEAEPSRDTMNLDRQKAVQSLFLEVRPARAGERFAPLGMAGRTRLVRDVLADAGWARAFRDSAPVVARCDTGEILWIIGLAQAESSRVTAGALSSRRSPNLLCLTAEFGC
jgi:tRNA(Ile)-lysidine synthetase-like protein